MKSNDKRKFFTTRICIVLFKVQRFKHVRTNIFYKSNYTVNKAALRKDVTQKVNKVWQYFQDVLL